MYRRGELRVAQAQALVHHRQCLRLTLDPGMDHLVDSPKCGVWGAMLFVHCHVSIVILLNCYAVY
jgi:hypothetical protein